MPADRPPGPELEAFLAPYAPAVRSLALRLRDLVLAEAPQATELLYDAYNAVAIAFTMSGRPADAFCHVAVYAGHVNLGFNRGAGLPDPGRRLQGTGRQIRHLKVRRSEDLDDPDLRTFLRLAVHDAPGAVPDRPAASVVAAVSARRRRPG